MKSVMASFLGSLALAFRPRASMHLGIVAPSAPTERVSAIAGEAARQAGGSSRLGLAVARLVRLAGSIDVCAATHDHCLATEALQGLPGRAER
jgi:hypothetical protein